MLSIVVPCYNEAATIDVVLDRLRALASAWATETDVEIVAVDDGSSDGTFARLSHRAATDLAGTLVVARHPGNRGKGAAIQTARERVRGEVVVIQDADLEYDPVDIPALIQPILGGKADAVFGSRFLGGRERRVLYFWHRVGNGVLTLLSNMLTNLNCTDMETGYKAFSREAFAAMHLTNRRFGIEPEIVARLSQMGARVYEVPISYYGRTYAEGKKITWRDGVAALGHIVRARLSSGAQRKLELRPTVYPSASGYREAIESAAAAVATTPVSIVRVR